MPRPARPQPNTGAVVQPKPAPLRLSARYLQPLAPPDALNAFGVHPPAFCPQQRRDPAVPVAAILRRQRYYRLGQYGLVGPNYPHLALRRTWLAQRATGATLGYPERRLHMPHASTAALGA